MAGTYALTVTDTAGLSGAITVVVTAAQSPATGPKNMASARLVHGALPEQWAALPPRRGRLALMAL